MEDQESDKLHNQDDVNPTTELDKLVNEDKPGDVPETNGTGANRPVPTAGTVIIKEESGKDQDLT
jgi:hypothetical protein